MIFHKIITLSLLFVVLSSKLSVLNYDELPSKFQNQKLKDIKYSLANFGFIPKGKTMVQQVVLSPHHSDQCNMTLPSDQQARQIQNSFILIPRGQCNFVFKVINAQKLGAKMAIIMDNQTHESKIIMADNGYGYKVTIPSIFINYQDGQLIQNIIESGSKITIKMEFETRKTAKVNLILWLQANNRNSYKLVSEFENYYRSISSYIDLTVVHDISTCLQCDIQNDCYQDGKYCSIHIIHVQAANGKKIIDQQIRQSLIYKYYPDQWWNFMRSFDQMCIKISQYEECSKQCMNGCGIESNFIQDRFKQIFKEKDNQILKTDLALLQYSGVTSFPSTSINYDRVKGSIKAEFIFDDICNSLQKPPKPCQPYIGDVIDQPHWSIVVIIVIIAIIILGIIFCLYRRKLRKNLNNQIEERVGDMVGRYVEFYTQRNNNNSNNHHD